MSSLENNIFEEGGITLQALNLKEGFYTLFRMILKPVLPYKTVAAKVTKLTKDLEDLLALPLENNMTYSNGIYQVDISQSIPLGAEPHSGRVFRLRFYLHRDYIRLQLLILPPFLRKKGWGRQVWELFLACWQNEYSYFEGEFKTLEAQRFWLEMGFQIDEESYIAFCPVHHYSGRKMFYKLKGKQNY